jgi:hypothetical protein
MLDRIGDEVARATSIVRYAPASRFSAHTHGGGEEFLVLEGVFQDEHGDYPAGSYFCNPPAPRWAACCSSSCGSSIYRTAHRCGATPGRWVYTYAQALPGVEIAALFHDSREEVRMGTLAAPRLRSIFPTAANFWCSMARLMRAAKSLPQSWLRLPPRGRLNATAGRDSCTLWVKTGHLHHIQTPPRP